MKRRAWSNAFTPNVQEPKKKIKMIYKQDQNESFVSVFCVGLQLMTNVPLFPLFDHTYENQSSSIRILNLNSSYSLLFSSVFLVLKKCFQFVYYLKIFETMRLFVGFYKTVVVSQLNHNSRCEKIGNSNRKINKTER